jgi:hypothetical protein
MSSRPPLPLAGEILTRRIYAPDAYALVRSLPIVPVVHAEASRLASFFPIVWTRQNDTPELVVLRSMIEDPEGQPPRGRRCFPLLLAAYPFVHAELDQPVSAPPLIDDVFADEPTDIGATILTSENKLGLGAQQRLDALMEFSSHRPLTIAIGKALADRNLLETWELKFEVEGGQIDVPGLEIARQAAFETGAFAPLLDEFGLPAAQLLALHRISLFRAGLLLTMAKAVMQKRAGSDGTAGVS